MNGMNNMNKDALVLLTKAGLEKCLLRMTEVSPGAWRLGDVRVFKGQVREALRSRERGGSRSVPNGTGQYSFSSTPLSGDEKPAAAIRIKIKGATPFVTAIIFNPEDIKHISRCFAEEQYYGPVSEEQPDVTVIEIGNILLNALANSLLRGFGKSAIPSVPAHFQGDYGAIEKWLGAGPEVFTIISAKFAMRREDRVSAAEILAFLPPTLAEDPQPLK
ncbi:MAG: hypothetical protein Q8O90_00270 [Elusimicrobiota bacterium]|nr:hypothetical protein [Elusimicrobiota bacterium]